MSLEALQERLAALQETTSQLRELIDRLGSLKFEPGSVPLGTDEENSVSGELSAEIGQMLRGGVEDQELLQEEVNYLRPEGQEKGRLKDGVEKVGQDLTSYRLAFRKARLSAKKSLVDAQKLERQLIMKSYSQPVPGSNSGDATEDIPMQPIQRFVRQQQQHSSLSEEDQQTVGASNNVTTALRRTHDLIASELSRSEFAHETLVESSAALKQLNESYGSLDTMLASSRDLLGTLVRSQKSDTWYLQTAMYMLMVTGAWLVFRRLLYGPIWWLVLFPLRILFGVGSTATKAILPKGSAPNQSGKVDVGGNEATEVKGIPKEVPTVKGGTEKFTDAVEEEVKKAVESAVYGETSEDADEPTEFEEIVDEKIQRGEVVHDRDEL